MDHIRDELKKIIGAGIRRVMPIIDGPVVDVPIEGPACTRVRVDGRDSLLMCSNDYLGLAAHPSVMEAAVKAIEKYGFGAGSSRLVSGNMEPHRALEDKLREFKRTPAALLFNSGYHANLGTIPVLVGRGDDIFSDRLNHASILDGALLSRANLKRYPHLDTDSLERLVKKSRARRKLIITDGVFSMDGDIAPLAEIAVIAERYNANVLIDDAHGTGVLGKDGRGTLEHAGLEGDPRIVQMGTLGKALGTFGAFVAGSKELIEVLVTRARSFVFTTALPPAVPAAALRAIELIEKEPDRLERLLTNAARMRSGLEGALGSQGSGALQIGRGITPIIPVVIHESKRTMAIAARLLEKGVFVQGIRPPTVPENTARLRVTVTSGHTTTDLDTAAKAIVQTLGDTLGDTLGEYCD